MNFRAKNQHKNTRAIFGGKIQIFYREYIWIFALKSKLELQGFLARKFIWDNFQTMWNNYVHQASNCGKLRNILTTLSWHLRSSISRRRSPCRWWTWSLESSCADVMQKGIQLLQWQSVVQSLQWSDAWHTNWQSWKIIIIENQTKKVSYF